MSCLQGRVLGTWPPATSHQQHSRTCCRYHNVVQAQSQRTACPRPSGQPHTTVQPCTVAAQQRANQLGPKTHRSPPRRCVSTAATADEDSAAAQPDIDQLAAFLTQKAAAMRASMDEQDLLAPGAAAADGEDDGSGGSEGASDVKDSDDLLSLDSLAALASADAAVPAGAALPGATGLMSTLDALEEFTDDRGFISQDFAITKLLGKLGVQDAAAFSPSSSGSATPTADPDGVVLSPSCNILVYAARYNSGLPYQGPVTVQLREYLAGSRRVAVNELLVQERLCGPLPQEKWEAAVAEPSADCPVVPLLGYLTAPPSDEAFEMTQDPADTVWLVYKFEGLRPLSLMLAQMDLPEEPAGLQALFLSKEAGVAAALAARRKLLMAIASGLLSAISYCHQRGVAHCGIGAGCVVVNSWADKDASKLVVKLDNFGLARVYPHPLEYGPDQLAAQLTPVGHDGSSSPAAVAPGGSSGDGSSSSSSSGSQVLLGLEDTDAALQRQEDLQAAALLLCEVLLVGCASAGAEVMDIASLKRLLFDVFHEDVALFKEYCLQDEDNYGGFVEFMDAEGGAGWALLEALMAGKTAAGELLRTAAFFSSSSSGSSSSSSSGSSGSSSSSGTPPLG